MPPAVWKSITEIAAMRGVRKSAVHKQVERLEREGLIATRREGRSRMVDLAAFQRAVGDTGDALREQAAETAKAIRTDEPAPSALRDAQTDKAKLEARRLALDLGERTGQLIAVKAVEAAMVRAGEAIVRTLERLPNFAPELMAAAKDGEPAMRRKLREIKDQLRRSAGEALTLQRQDGTAEEDAGGDLVDLAEAD